MMIIERNNPVAIIFFTVAITFFLVRTPLAQPTTPAPDRVREVEFQYRAEIAGIDRNARVLEAWVPLPHTDNLQRIVGLSIENSVTPQIIDQGSGGNSIAYFKATAPLPASIRLTLRFKAQRIEESADLVRAAQAGSEPLGVELAEFVRPYRLVPTSGRIAEVSATIGHTEGLPYDQARAIYDYIVATMKYDKSGAGWGRGDAIYACDVKKGNCTDFHSLFIAIARSRGIPARFIIGFPLGHAAAGDVSGYHCWAEFYAGGQWIPVDASEAWKHPELRNYYFGHLDADRIAFTTGRDLTMIPPQHGAPLNFLIYPYVELDGRPAPSTEVITSFRYSEIPRGK
jgi:transglutaminase-like putative cysteine protease